MKYPDLNGLTVCRALLEDAVISKLAAIQEKESETVLATVEGREGAMLSGRSRLADLLIQQAEKLGISGDLLPAYIIHCLVDGENTAARTVEATGTYGDGLVEAMEHDMKVLLPYIMARTSEFTKLDFTDWYEPAKKANNKIEKELQRKMLRVKTERAAKALLELYRQRGSGMLARYTAFRIGQDGALIGIDDFPVFAWDDLLGYEEQKSKLIEIFFHQDLMLFYKYI